MKKTKILCECAILLALSIVLSFIKIYRMPLGGGITLVSMLPVLCAGVRRGIKWGLGTSLLLAAFQLVQSIASGNVFPYCQTAAIVVLCVLFDYLLPFGALGLSGIAHSGTGKPHRQKILLVFAALIFFRFVCHFITGVFIWGQWAPEGMGKFIYSLVYNAQYMFPELVLTLLATWFLTASSVSSRLFSPDEP